MHIGLLTLHLAIPQAESLKDKRHALKSLIAHLRNGFNVSVAEVADQDAWRRATVAVTVVSGDTRVANRVLENVVDHVENDWRVVLENYAVEML
jgi:uncharacterized protein YlxP (DUF503 family)